MSPTEANPDLVATEGVRDPGSADRATRWYHVPWRREAFWGTQLLVFAIATVHLLTDSSSALGADGPLAFVPVSLFFVPVVFAATSFGVAGSVPTALWCVVLTVPLWTAYHPGDERTAELVQLSVIVLVAAFVGTRVDRQGAARAAAEAAGNAFRVSESKYRGLFEGSGEGILIVRHDATEIVEANEAAARVLGGSATALTGARLADVLADEALVVIASAIREPALPPLSARIETAPGVERWIQPVCRPLADDTDLTQVLLRDVTEQQSRGDRVAAYAGQVLAAQEDERRRIAQELHDDTIQSLIALCRVLDMQLGADEPNVARDQAEAIVTRIRGFIQGLRPPALDDLGLAEAIRRLMLDLRDRSKIEVELDVTGTERRIAPTLELAIFRIAQEALNNIERHSGASEVQVEIDYRAGAVALRIHDDGRGFEVPERTDELPGERKLGLMGMHERARAIGASLRIESSIGRGTTVIVDVATTEPVEG